MITKIFVYRLGSPLVPGNNEKEVTSGKVLSTGPIAACFTVAQQNYIYKHEWKINAICMHKYIAIICQNLIVICRNTIGAIQLHY